MNVLEVRNLTIPGILHGLTFEVGRGERVGLIGESGSGKSQTALSIMGLVAHSGDVELDGKAAMVFQEPLSALDPLMKISRQLHYAGATPESLKDVDLDPAVAKRYPHELSGGQRQRVLIAMALAQNPELLICDEPTTALDATTQAGVLALIERLADERGFALLFISHDLRVIDRMTTRRLLLKAGHFESLESEYGRSLVPQPITPSPARTGEPIIEVHAAAPYGLEHVDLTVARGERLAVVGGSGSGKTTLLKMLTGLLKPASGTIEIHGKIQMVFQDPRGSLNPRLRVGRSIKEGGPDVAQALVDVGLQPSDAKKYPHEFSGGQRQRISIARALVGRPDILLADEAVSALDVTVRRQILELLDRLVDEYGLTLVFVTHDLGVVKEICSSVAVVHEGRIVEHGPVDEIWEHPQHPYTQRLLAAAKLP